MGKVGELVLQVLREIQQLPIRQGTDRKVITLGHYPVVSLQDARRKALAAFVAPNAPMTTITVPEAKEAFLAQSKRVLESNLRHFPWKGPLRKISHEEVVDVLDNIKGRSARAHALKDAVSATCRFLQAVLGITRADTPWLDDWTAASVWALVPSPSYSIRQARKLGHGTAGKKADRMGTTNVDQWVGQSMILDSGS